MLDGNTTEPEAVEATKVATRRFVRRQRAWFRRDPRIRWLDPEGDLLQQGMAELASK
jgi:tRNA dimethylallyltransferase